MTSSPRSLFDDETFPEPPLPWEAVDAADLICAEIVFNLPVDQTFHYLIPDELRGQIAPGQRLKVPFGRGNQVQMGYCVGVGSPPAGWNPEKLRKLKTVVEIFDPAPLLSPRMLALTRWIGERYLCAWGQVLESVIPAGVKRQAGTRMVNMVRLAQGLTTLPPHIDLTPKQKLVWELVLAAEHPLPQDELARAAKCGPVPIQGLCGKGVVEIFKQRAGNFSLPEVVNAPEIDLELNADQRHVLDRLLTVIRDKQHRTMLLHGVTGSGKTEVYIQAIREVVSYGRQAIVLVPEISLTPQTIRRFQSRFPNVAVLHSHLGDAERHWHWQEIAHGRVQVVVGARSAIFAPCPHLGLIIIDEEHETTFKQDSTPRYHTREVARKRAELESIPLLLGSATPTLESWQRALDGLDELLSMPRRVASLPMPPVVIVDVRNDPELQRGSAIGRALRNAMHSALQEGGQIILFLNLRGFSPLMWCRACGQGVKCPHCDITLTLHKDKQIALCHSCDYQIPPPSHCPHCQHAGVKYLGTGTQRLEQEVIAKFKAFACLRMDSDSMQRPGSHDQALERFRKGEIRILLGTQMIAKGLDFPNVTLVGVIDADTILHQPDLRSAERTFHLIAQVAGRTGRSQRGGRVLVQTSSPEEYPIQMASRHDFVSFATLELEHRQQMQAPPFLHLARIVLRGPVEQIVQTTAQGITDQLRSTVQKLALPVRILGPAPAPVTRLKGLYRYHLQLSATQVSDLQTLWRAVRGDLAPPPDVEFAIDVDPLNLR